MSRRSKSGLLGLVVALSAATFAPAGAAPDPAAVLQSEPGTPAVDSWGSSVCGFAMMLTLVDKSFMPSAHMICARVYGTSDG
jgi:hypothetical protein